MSMNREMQDKLDLYKLDNDLSVEAPVRVCECKWCDRPLYVGDNWLDEPEGVFDTEECVIEYRVHKMKHFNWRFNLKEGDI